MALRARDIFKNTRRWPPKAVAAEGGTRVFTVYTVGEAARCEELHLVRGEGRGATPCEG